MKKRKLKIALLNPELAERGGCCTYSNRLCDALNKCEYVIKEGDKEVKVKVECKQFKEKINSSTNK